MVDIGAIIRTGSTVTVDVRMPAYIMASADGGSRAQVALIDLPLPRMIAAGGSVAAVKVALGHLATVPVSAAPEIGASAAVGVIRAAYAAGGVEIGGAIVWPVLEALSGPDEPVMVDGSCRAIQIVTVTAGVAP